MKRFAKIVALYAVILFFPLGFAFANIEINEVMYDLKTGSDDGREWVEIYNGGDAEIDFSTFKFFEGDTNHKVLLKQGNTKIPARGYAVVVSDETKFKTDWPNFAGTIFDSSFSLSNSGESLAIKDGDQAESLIVDQFIYQSSMGGAGNSKSLQKINAVWLEAAPTPGAENKLPLRQIVAEVEPKPKTSVLDTTATTKKAEEPEEAPIVYPDTPSAGAVTEPEGRNQPYLFAGILAVFLALGGGVVYFIRRQGTTPKTGDDFEILEE